MHAENTEEYTTLGGGRHFVLCEKHIEDSIVDWGRFRSFYSQRGDKIRACSTPTVLFAQQAPHLIHQTLILFHCQVLLVGLVVTLGYFVCNLSRLSPCLGLLSLVPVC